jgi:hypothetical protein
MKLLQQSKCMGDLMRYYGESKFKLMEDVQKISSSRGLSEKLLNTIRKHTGVAGLKIDQLVSGLETASQMDIFGYTVNGVNPCEIFQDKDVVLEVSMSPVYFATKASLGASLPGFRKVKTLDKEDHIQALARKEQENWIRWFEKELNKYHTRRLWERKILEE